MLLSVLVLLFAGFLDEGFFVGVGVVVVVVSFEATTFISSTVIFSEILSFSLDYCEVSCSVFEVVGYYLLANAAAEAGVFVDLVAVVRLEIIGVSDVAVVAVIPAEVLLLELFYVCFRLPTFPFRD